MSFKLWLLLKAKQTLSFIESLARRGVVDYLEKLLPVALDIVTEIAKSYSTTDGEQKRALAVKRLSSYATSIGIEVGTSLLNLAIEMAVQRMKANEGKTN